MFARPLYLLLFLPFAAFLFFLLRKGFRQQRVTLPVFSLIEKVGFRFEAAVERVLDAAPLVALALVIVAMAGPRTGYEEKEIYTEGKDIVIILDDSGSMQAMDFNPNRLEKAKEVVKAFIQGRLNDRIGLVVFAGKAFTQCPMTLDYRVLNQFVDLVEPNMIEDGTAIGNAIATAINRVKDSPAKSRIAILLTDGENNKGNVDPVQAAEIAAQLGIKIYTIGVGSDGKVKIPVQDPVLGRQFVYAKIPLNETLLKDIARKTGGIYYFVNSENMLKDVFTEIDKYEKSLIKSKRYMVYNDKSFAVILAAMVLLFAYVLGQILLLRRVP